MIALLAMLAMADEYVVLVEKDDYAAAGRRLAEHRKAEVVTVSYDDLAAVAAELKKRRPAYVAVVADPSRVDTNFVRRLLVMSTTLDDDPFCDFAYGIITGRTPKEALAFVERILRAEKEGLPKRMVSAGVSSKVKSFAYDKDEAGGWTRRHVYWSETGSDPDAPAFVREHLKDLEGAGLLEITGNGDPERIWLFPGERNMDRSKHRPYDPKKVGQDPDGEMFCITAKDIATLDLYPAVVTIGSCHSGSLSRTFVAPDIVSTFGRAEKCEVYDIPPEKSLGLEFLARGATAYIAPAGFNHGFRCDVETRRLLETGCTLGELMKSCADELVVAMNGKLSFAAYEKGGDADPDPEPMMSGAANRVLFGDPAFRPFAKAQAPGLEVRREGDVVHVTVRGAFVPEVFDQFTRRTWRVHAVVDVEGAVTGVTADGDVEIAETRWLLEDGRRLHLAAYSRAKKLEDGASVRFTIGRGTATKPAKRDEKALWTRDLKSASYGSGAVADLDGDGKLEIVFGTYFNDERIYCLNAEDGTVAWTFTSEGGPFDASIAIADLDGDGKPEVMSGDSSTGTLFILNGDGTKKGSIKLPNSTDSPPAVADLDGDGKPEIVVGSMWKRNGMGDVGVYCGDTLKPVWSREVKGCVQSEPCLVDLDGDQVLDVIVTSWRGDNAVHAFSGRDGTDLWTYETMTQEDTPKDHLGMYHGVAAGVLEKGGELRIAFGTCSSARGTLTVLDAKGKLVWKKVLKEYLFAPVTMADLDGDGSREIVAIGTKTHTFRADGKELWTADVGSSRGPAIVDADGDGDLDLVMGARGRRLVVLDGPTGAVVMNFVAKAGDDPREETDSAALVADFDGDGRLDAFVVGGKGTSDTSRPQNYGRAFAFVLGKGKGSWVTFRGSLQRDGWR